MKEGRQMETNDLKPLEWSKLGPINRAQITSFRAFDPVNGREAQAWDRPGAGHGWELSDCEENGGWGGAGGEASLPVCGIDGAHVAAAGFRQTLIAGYWAGDRRQVVAAHVPVRAGEWHTHLFMFFSLCYIISYKSKWKIELNCQGW